NDGYFFNGGNLGEDVITETASSHNTLNFLGFDGPISLDLTKNTKQTLSAGKLALTLTNPEVFTGVVGTRFNDVIQANASHDRIIGAGGQDSITGGSGDDYLQGNITQVVYVQFDEAMTPGAHVYTDAEKVAIVAGLKQIYAAFDHFFTTDLATAQAMAQATGGQFAALLINQGPGGGAANQLDPGNLDLGGAASININPFLGDAAGQITPSSANIINFTITIAAH